MTRNRAVVGLSFAEPCDRPENIPIGRPRGRKAAGVRYERELAKAIPGAKHGQWFRFRDVNGWGHCQPDLLLGTGLGIAILEAKYTWTQAGHSQIEQLYKPVVELALGRPCFGLVVCRVLTAETPRAWICRDLDEAISRAATGRPTVLHWIGAGLGPLQRRYPPAHLAPRSAVL